MHRSSKCRPDDIAQHLHDFALYLHNVLVHGLAGCGEEMAPYQHNLFESERARQEWNGTSIVENVNSYRSLYAFSRNIGIAECAEGLAGQHWLHPVRTRGAIWPGSGVSPNVKQTCHYVNYRLHFKSVRRHFTRLRNHALAVGSNRCKLVLSYQHIGWNAPLRCQDPNHGQREWAPPPKDFRGMGLRADQRGEILLS